MPKEPVFAVEARGVSPQKPFHAGDQVGLGRFDHEMKMIVHQAIGVDLPTGLGAGFGQGGQEQLPVSVVQEDRFPAIAPAHQMINRSRILQTKLSRHGRRMPPLTYSVNPQCGIARN